MGILCSIILAAAGFLSVSIGDALDKLLVFEQTHAEADATPIYLRRALKMPERSPLAIVEQHRGNTARDTRLTVRPSDCVTLTR
jgi:hypothetical protein